MAFTGQLGTNESYLANIALGTAGGGGLEQFVNHTLVLVQTAGAGQSATASSTLAIIDSATGTVTHFASASHTITLTDEAISSIKMASVSDTLALVQLAEGRAPISIALSQSMSLVQQGDGHVSVVNKSVTDVLGLTDRGNRTIFATVTQTITLTDVGRRFLGAFETLNLIQTVSVGKSKGGVKHVLPIFDIVAVQSLLTRVVTHPLNLIQAASYSVFSSTCQLQSYTPFVGTGDPSFTPPSTTAPVLGNGTLTLTHPFVTPTTTLVLKNPMFGNVERLAFNRISRESRGGTLNVFAEVTWPKEDVLVFTIAGLRPQAFDSLRSFLLTSVGREIGLLDWENRQWKGIILNPDTVLSQPGREDLSVSLQFEGALV